MRDYSKVSGEFWTGKTGKSLRGDMQTQIIAMYLMTSRHSNMIGVFHCPVLYMAHETGSPLEGAIKSLDKLVEGGFCTYDDDSETVWVHEMARFQIDDALKAGDKRILGIQKQYDLLPESPIKYGFYEKYAQVFHIKNINQSKPHASPLEAPTKREAVTEAGTGTEAGAEEKSVPHLPSKSGVICLALKSEGIGSVSPANPKLQVLIDAGAEIQMFVDAARAAKARGKAGFSYVLATVDGQMQEAAAMSQQGRERPAEVFETPHERSMRLRYEEATGKRTSPEREIIDITPLQTNQARIA